MIDIITSRTAAERFIQDWKDRGDEKQDTQNFWNQLLRTVYGVEVPEQYIKYEKPIAKGFIDAYIPDTKVLIEQKGMSIDLDAKELRQGKMMTPYEQAHHYVSQLALQEKPLYIITCNFQTFRIYDCRIQPKYDRKSDTWYAPFEEIQLLDLSNEFRRLGFLANVKDRKIKKEMEVSVQAGELVGLIYDKLLSQYQGGNLEENLKSLNQLCVRLVFCFYAEDAGIFNEKNTSVFYDYMKAHRNDARSALIRLFKILDTKEEERDPYEDEDLLAFPYVNGGLFADDSVIIPRLTPEIIDLILEKASEEFDWSGISPTIFGAVFESTLNPETRRSGGMHYTSIENIHKVIAPLFLDDLKMELEEIINHSSKRGKNKKLLEFQKKLASLKFLDPAAGSGNFLTESYLCLRRLENRILEEIYGRQMMLVSPGGEESPIKVSIHQFYGIEINDFAATVAKTALWIAELQMIKETELMMFTHLNLLPLKSFEQIVEGNALRMDWNDVVPAGELNYIMGNPPFVGARLMNKAQKEDILAVFGSKYKNVGNLDYVCCWYKKSAEIMKNTTIKAALVSTNSVCQGETVANLWKPLFEEGIHFDFAYKTFRWDSEASMKAHVHCVIVGFSFSSSTKEKYIWDGENIIKANNINGYLIDADNIFISSRTKPICDVPKIGIGNKPIDGGYYLFEKEEKDNFIEEEPLSEKYFKPWYGASEFIKGKPRYCLWLGDCTPNELKKMPNCMKRVKSVCEFRLKSKSAGTVKLAKTPTRFHVENMPSSDFLLVPRVSSERRRYVPIGFMSKDVMVSDAVQIVPNATLYHFGILESNVHMSWMRTVSGRLKSDYRYSKDVVYNNFPWPSPTESQRKKIEKTAQGILDARALYPDSSLADLYDPLTMPPELLKAHQANDKAVMEAYGIKKGNPEYSSESACVAMLMKMYEELVEKEKNNNGGKFMI